MTALTALLWVATPPAQAQERAARTAAVLEFGSDVAAGALVGRAAQSTLSLQLAERQYTVWSRSQVVDAVNRLGIKPPLEPDEVRALAKELDAREVFSGRVLSIEDRAGPPASVRVVLRIEVYDGATGDLVNGAVVDGMETATGGGEPETLRYTAVERATARALTQIESRTLLTAAILSVSPAGLALLNRGSRAGMSKGMLFDIFRAQTSREDPTQTVQVKVGRVRVTTVSPDDAEADIIDAPQGVQNNDQLRQVFVLPETTVSGPSAATPPRGGKGLGGLLAGVLGTVAGVGLLLLLFSMNENTVRDAPVVDPSTGAYLRQSTPGQNPSVVVQWGDRDFAPPPNYIGGYFIYRGQSENFAAIESEAIGVTAGAAQRNFADDPTWNHIQTTIPVRFQIIQGDSADQIEEDVDVEIVHQSPQPGQTYFYKVRRIGPPSVLTPPSLIDNSSGNRMFDPRASRSRSAQLRARAKGMVLQSGGNIRVTRHNRTVTRLRQTTSIPPGPNYDTTLNPEDDNDLGLSNDIGLSDASAAVGPVTYIVPPELRAPSDNNQAQRIDDISFEYQGQLGVTEYVLQVARNINFSPLIFESAPIQTTASTVLSFRYNSGQAGFVTLAPNSSYFWRVGARSRFRNQALPQPENWVFSRVFTFTTADQPPTAP
ncbi:MAG: hypothetical protein IT204_04720 [Fimbriimonadaceae bacterium]|nr:hypothetical protein [Fimbriimonadaceae bacterium]